MRRRRRPWAFRSARPNDAGPSRGLGSIANFRTGTATKIREAWGSYRRAQDLIHLGAYTQGSDPKLDASIAAREQMLAFLGQDPELQSPIEETLSGLTSIASVLV